MTHLLRHTEIGQGEPLLILHGLFGSSSNWRTVANALAKHFRVYTMDARNHGSSPWNESMNYRVMTDDVAYFLDYHGLTRTHIIGHSMGGKTAMFFALNHPDKVDKLVIADIAPKAYDHGSEHLRFIDAMLDLDLKNLSGGRKQAELLLTEKLGEPGPIIQFLLQNLHYKDQLYQWRINLPVLRRSLPVIMAEFDSNGGSQSMADSLFIYGEKSDYVDETDYPLISRWFPNAVFWGIEGAGHWLHAERPQQFVDTVKQFLGVDSVNI